MTPDETHAAVMAGLSQLSQLAADSHADRWINLDLRGIMLGERDGTPRPGPPVRPLDADVALAVQLRNGLGAVHRGRRRIIERHAPRIHRSGDAYCRGTDDHNRVAEPWPCETYLDAAADLIPKETT